MKEQIISLDQRNDLMIQAFSVNYILKTYIIRDV